jgi:hypothetical protein
MVVVVCLMPAVRHRLENSTVSNNSSAAGAGTGGGGLRNAPSNDRAATLTITNSTISSNRNNRGNGRGGAINNEATLNLRNMTITNNQAQRQGGGIFNNGTVNLQNTMVAANGLCTILGGVCLPSQVLSSDCFGTLDSQGFNLLGNNANCTFTATTSDQVGTAGSPIDPVLGPLQDNGGLTMTHALLKNSPDIFGILRTSPAIDAGNPATPGSQPNACEVTDQRRFVRSDICDIGAFEFGAVPP